MNQILQLKGQFMSRKYTGQFGPTNLPKGAVVTKSHICELKKQLKQILTYWEHDTQIGGALVSTHYYRIVAKSNRVVALLSYNSKDPNNFIVGSKFVWEPNEKTGVETQKHVFSYFVPLEAIKKSIDQLEVCERIIHNDYAGKITKKETEEINKGRYSNKSLTKNRFLRIVVDAFYVERFDIDKPKQDILETSLVTIYKTGVETSKLLTKFGIDMINAKMLNDTTLILNKEDIQILLEKAPYLISMSVKDFAKIVKEDIVEKDDDIMLSIPEPKNEPVVGVIDTQFDDTVYFSKWVKEKNMLPAEFDITTEDKFHGTAVSSIIVDGPHFNPKYDDGCGRFQVRHFGVATEKGFSSYAILKMIRDIVAQNRDIKVWNLSLGSSMQIDLNFISPEAAELDRLQSEYDVIFVIAGTNMPDGMKGDMRIGAPADSLNSLVVNSVTTEGKAASYSRRGPVLSFFNKPDVCYYGGDGKDRITVCAPLGSATVTGTSFAAPWITRKVAYLIHVMGLSREVAKALIIDSAAKWNKRDNNSYKLGYGIVPIKISEILQSDDDEIRFIMTGTISDYEMYTYNIPVPQNKQKYPYFAKATMVYFPKNDRNKGVDYTNTEMDIHFGRLYEKNGKDTINPINNNVQSEDDDNIVLYEEAARKMYRKWDNVKHIGEVLNPKARPKKAYESGMWGLSIKTKERVKAREGRGLQFGIIVTLKEMYGVNRIDEFVQRCIAKGWLVNKLDVENQLDIFEKAEEDITLE